MVIYDKSRSVVPDTLSGLFENFPCKEEQEYFHH